MVYLAIQMFAWLAGTALIFFGLGFFGRRLFSKTKKLASEDRELELNPEISLMEARIKELEMELATREPPPRQENSKLTEIDDGQLDDLRKENTELKAKIENLTQSLDVARDKMTSEPSLPPASLLPLTPGRELELERTLAEKEAALEASENRINDLAAEIVSLRTAAAQLDSEKSSVASERENEVARLKSQLTSIEASQAATIENAVLELRESASKLQGQVSDLEQELIEAKAKFDEMSQKSHAEIESLQAANLSLQQDLEQAHSSLDSLFESSSAEKTSALASEMEGTLLEKDNQIRGLQLQMTSLERELHALRNAPPSSAGSQGNIELPSEAGDLWSPDSLSVTTPIFPISPTLHESSEVLPNAPTWSPTAFGNDGDESSSAESPASLTHWLKTRIDTVEKTLLQRTGDLDSEAKQLERDLKAQVGQLQSEIESLRGSVRQDSNSERLNALDQNLRELSAELNSSPTPDRLESPSDLVELDSLERELAEGASNTFTERSLEELRSLLRERDARIAQLNQRLSNTGSQRSPEFTGDNLELIKGVGPYTKQILEEEFEIFTFRQIALMDEALLDRLSKRLFYRTKIEREDWISQAIALHVTKYGELLENTNPPYEYRKDPTRFRKGA